MMRTYCSSSGSLDASNTNNINGLLFLSVKGLVKFFAYFTRTLALFYLFYLLGLISTALLIMCK